MSLAIQDVCQSFELLAGGPLVGVNTFQAMVTCALYDELVVYTRLVHSAGYAVTCGYLVTVAIYSKLVRHLVQSDLCRFRNLRALSSVFAMFRRHSSGPLDF